MTSPKYDHNKPADMGYLDYYKPSMIPSPPDPRDFVAAEHEPTPKVALPVKYELPEDVDTDQGRRGSCAAFAAAEQARNALKTDSGIVIDPSEEVEYSAARDPQYNYTGFNGVGQDSGSMPRDHMKILQQFGLVLESQVPYMSQPLDWRVSPALWNTVPPEHRIEKYYVCQTEDDVRQAIYGSGANDGRDVSYCFTLFQNWEPDLFGNLPHPNGGVWGGHNIRCRGWDNTRAMPCGHTGAWKVRNQWHGWGYQGQDNAWICYESARLPQNQGGVWTADRWAVTARKSVPPPPPPPIPTDKRKFYMVSFDKQPSGWTLTENVQIAGVGQYPQYRSIQVDNGDGKPFTVLDNKWYQISPMSAPSLELESEYRITWPPEAT